MRIVIEKKTPSSTFLVSTGPSAWGTYELEAKPIPGEHILITLDDDRWDHIVVGWRDITTHEKTLCLQWHLRSPHHDIEKLKEIEINITYKTEDCLRSIDDDWSV